MKIKNLFKCEEVFCRGGRIRTYDLLVPNQARYRATLRPENFFDIFEPATLALKAPRRYRATLRPENFFDIFEPATLALKAPRRYRATLRPEMTSTFISGEGGIRTLGTELPVRQFSKLLISATHPPHRFPYPLFKGLQK